MMHAERASFSTSVIVSTNKGFVMMSTDAQSRRPPEPTTSTSTTNNSTTQQSTSTMIETTDRSGFTSSSSLDPQDWRDLSSKLSSDTTTVFPLLHSKSSASSLWPEELLPHRTTSGTTYDEEEKRVDTSFRDDSIINAFDFPSSDQHADDHHEGTFWPFSTTPQSLLGDFKEQPDNDNDDDSSAALSLFLESKLAAIWLEDDGEADVAQPELGSHKINQPLHKQSVSTSTSVPTKALPKHANALPDEIESNRIPMPPPPKHLDMMSRRQSAPSVFDSGRTQQRGVDQLSMSDHNPVIPPPLDTVYNPITGYSPGRSARKRIWGASNAHLPPRRGIPDRHVARHHSDTSTSSEADSSSVTSEEMLERWSSRVRGELRYAELVELAEEAERAADAGEESYTGRPWLCVDGGEAGEVLSPRLTQPSVIKRHASYSEGFPMPTSPLRPRLPQGVRNLRDAEDVFPPFGMFHNNLRTHYLRSHIPESVLVFDEEETDNSLDGKNFHGSKIVRHKKGGSRNFMDSFNFDILRRRGSSRDLRDLGRDAKVDFGLVGINSSGSTEDEASDVGEILAEHLHSADRPLRRPSHPMSLPGLPTLEATQSVTNGSQHGSTSESFSYGSTALGRSPSMDEEGPVKPRVLFPGRQKPPGLNLPALSADEETTFPRSPVTPLHQGGTHDFVTPARLREIRRPKADIGNFVNEQIMILPANSVVQESPLRKTPGSIASPGRQEIVPGNTRLPVKDLLLPAFSAGTQEESEPVVHLAPSHSYDSLDDDDDIAPNPLSVKDRALAKQMRTFPPREAPLTPTKQDARTSPKSNSPVASSVVGSDDGTSRTEVHVSILDKSLDSSPAQISPSRRIIRPSTVQAERSLASGHKVYSMTQVLASTPQDSFDAIDCRCLSPSMEHVHDLLESEENNVGLGRKPCGTRDALHGAMSMFKNLSPGRERKIAQGRVLFVHPRDNDDFLQNYLYCTKDPQKEGEHPHNGDVCITGEPCQDDGFCGAGFTLAYTYCGFRGQDSGCASVLGGTRSRTALDILPLALNPHRNYTTQADNWFEAATDRVDGMLERFVTGTAHKDDRFQPPSLRKIMRSEARSAKGSIQDSLEDEHGAVSGTLSSMERRPSVQALFKPEEDELSDTHFALVYGASRSDYHASVVTTSSPLRADVVDQQQQPIDLTRHAEIATSYSSSSDEELLSVTYISEPSM